MLGLLFSTPTQRFQTEASALSLYKILQSDDSQFRDYFRPARSSTESGHIKANLLGTCVFHAHFLVADRGWQAKTSDGWSRTTCITLLHTTQLLLVWISLSPSLSLSCPEACLYGLQDAENQNTNSLSLCAYSSFSVSTHTHTHTHMHTHTHTHTHTLSLSLSLSETRSRCNSRKIPPPNIFPRRSKTGVSKFSSAVNLAYPNFTPQTKASQHRITSYMQNMPLRILLGVSFAYADFTALPKS